MIWIIPMSGKGSRTSSLGEFKPFIEIKGHKILSWFISSIKHLIKPSDIFILITTDYFDNKFNFKDECKSIFKYHKLNNKIEFIINQKTPNGSSETVYSAKKLINNNSPVIVIYPDQYIDFVLPKINKNSAYMGVYIQLSDKSGFVEIKDGLIVNFVEKINISNIASSGFYIVSQGKYLIFSIERQFRSNLKINNEFYLGPAFNFLINKINIYPIPIISKYDLGNIYDIEYFSAKNIQCL